MWGAVHLSSRGLLVFPELGETSSKSGLSYTSAHFRANTYTQTKKAALATVQLAAELAGQPAVELAQALRPVIGFLWMLPGTFSVFSCFCSWSLLQPPV